MIDKVGYPCCFAMLGNTMFLLTFTFVGPLPFVPFEPEAHVIQVHEYSNLNARLANRDVYVHRDMHRRNLHNVRTYVCGPNSLLSHMRTIHSMQAMMALAGIAYASLVVSSFSRAQKKVLEMGFADDINTYVMISGTDIRVKLDSRWIGVCEEQA